MKVQSFQAAQAYNTAKATLQANTATQNSAQNSLQTNGTENTPAATETLAYKTMHNLTQSVAKGESAAMAYMSQGADPHSVVEAIAAAEMAVETAVTVRDKVVEAYQELIRMPI